MDTANNGLLSVGENGVRSCNITFNKSIKIMVRAMRMEFPGAVYHIAARENERRKIFLIDRDREAFIKTILHIMGNHYHLINAKEHCRNIL